MRILVPKNSLPSSNNNRTTPTAASTTTTSTTTTTTTTTSATVNNNNASAHSNLVGNIQQTAHQRQQQQQQTANERSGNTHVVRGEDKRAQKQQAVSDNNNNNCPVRKSVQRPEKQSDAEGYNSDDEIEKATLRKQPVLSRGSFQEDSQGVLYKDIKVGNKKIRLHLRKMAEDGNCLFRAIADQIYGDQEMHASVRKLCMDYIQAERDHYSQFVTEDFESYMNRKRRSKCFGNNVEIQAISELYNRPVEVYTEEPIPLNIFHSSYNTDNPPMRLWYNGVNHYNSLVDPYAATIGVGLGLPDFKPGLIDKMQLDQAINVSEEEELEKRYLAELQKETDWEVTEKELEEAAIAASIAEYWQSVK